MIHPTQLLLTPIAIYFGFCQGFFFGEFMAGWVACPTYFGVSYIHLILMTYGLCEALSSILHGVVNIYTGRQLFGTIAVMTNGLVMITLLTTFNDKPLTPNSHLGLFILTGCFGTFIAILRIELHGNI